MRYLGGKSRTYKEICAFLESLRKPDQPFVEPFCGGCWITQGMSGERYAADANAALITMWKASQNNYSFPEYVSKDEYLALQSNQDPNDPMTAFVGIGYSFGGKWFGGYADRLDPKQHLGDPRISVAKKMAKMRNVKFAHKNYQDVNVTNCLIYCDPPYANTTSYSGVGKFDSEAFWDKVRLLVANGNTVVVSEYTAPDDFTCVWSKQTKTEIRTKEGRADRTEKLFMHESLWFW